MASRDDKPSLHFIQEIVEEDNRANRWDGRVQTRFPPEPNGYLHIGHAKSIWLNFGLAKQYRGKCNLRFDDTNPSKEEDEYVRSIIEDVRWLGVDWDGHPLYASDYFEGMYDRIRALRLCSLFCVRGEMSFEPGYHCVAGAFSTLATESVT